MASKKYIEARNSLVKAIELANEVLLEYPHGRKLSRTMIRLTRLQLNSQKLLRSMERKLMCT